jgi:hypothetical protein
MKFGKWIFGTVGLTLVLVIAAGCASSPDTASTGYGASEAIEGDPDRMVCRRDKETGSRLASRTCKTAREWEEERERNQEAMRNATRSPQQPSNLPTAGGG